MISFNVKSDAVQKMVGDMMKTIGPDGRKKFFKSASAVLYKDIIKHFADEKDSNGRKWERWADPHHPGQRVNERPYGRGGGKMLQDTGRLRMSIQPASDEDGAYVGTDVVYGPAHNFGHGSTPAREFLYISQDAEETLVNIGQKWLDGKL